MALADLGWDEDFAKAFAAWKPNARANPEAARALDVEPGRVVIEFNYLYRVHLEAGEIEATVSGRMKHRAGSRGELPAVGDWVVVRRRPVGDRGTIAAILPRRSRFSRRAAGQVTDEQVVASNVDVVFIVMGLDPDYSLRRLERYLLLARESGAAPVVLLTKPDLCEDVPARVAEVVAVTRDVPVHVLSPKFSAPLQTAGSAQPSGVDARKPGIEQVAAYLPPGRTGALLGSSGVGKTTIINRLSGSDLRKTRDVRASDSTGQHTTSHRELVMLPGGGLIIDTPGMRELQLWDVGDAVRETFDDVEAFAGECHFTDCRHRNEPRCAVKAAVAAGRVAAGRLESYLKLQDELAHLERQQDERAQLELKRRSRIVTKATRQHIKSKRG